LSAIPERQVPVARDGFADHGYDRDTYRDQVRARGIVPAIARRGTLHGTGLGTYRWVVLACCPITHRQPSSLR
jgi:hypothetical protein